MTSVIDGRIRNQLTATRASQIRIDSTSQVCVSSYASSDIPARPMPKTHSAMSAGNVILMCIDAIVCVSPLLRSPG
jgi:hypothetical protein